MARNEEKALTLFSKWDTFKRDFHSDKNKRRPLFDAECNSLADAEKFRREIISNLTKKVSSIRNAGLGEPRIRELNDEINKLLRQKHFWEKKVRELGGVINTGKQLYDVDGKELPGAPGYKYFGAAKDLPGIRELFAAREEQDKAQYRKILAKRTRAELYKHVTPDYYGFGEDGEDINNNNSIYGTKMDYDEENDTSDEPTAKHAAYTSSLVEAESKRERELLRSVPRYVPSSVDSDEENEHLAALPLIAQQQMGILASPSTHSNDTNSNNSSNNSSSNAATATSAAQELLHRIEEQQRLKSIEFSKKQLLEKFKVF